MEKLKALSEQVILHPEPGSFTAEGESSRWSNKDLDPVPQSNKKWEWYHVGGFWIAEGFNVAQLETPSSAVALGLNPGLAIVACLIGNLLVTIPTCSSAYIGSKFGLNFPVVSRASFGMRGAYVAMVIRGVVCVIWMGVQSSVGGNAVRCMIEAIWPSFKHWHEDALPASACEPHALHPPSKQHELTTFIQPSLPLTFSASPCSGSRSFLSSSCQSTHCAGCSWSRWS